MPSESPEGRESRLTDHVMVRLDDFFSRTMDKEVNVDNSTGCDITENAATSSCVVLHDGGLSI